jgi:hypothetical protein
MPELEEIRELLGEELSSSILQDGDNLHFCSTKNRDIN